MTPKQEYETRKAKRKERRDFAMDNGLRYDEKDAELTEMADRLITAIERIADALETRK